MPESQCGGKDHITSHHTTLRHRSNKLPSARNSFLTSASPAAKGCINPSPKTTAAVVSSLIKERKKTDPHSTAPGQQRQKSSSTLLNACCHNFKKANDTEISSPALPPAFQTAPQSGKAQKNLSQPLPPPEQSDPRHNSQTTTKRSELGRTPSTKSRSTKSPRQFKKLPRVYLHTKMIQKRRRVSRQSIPRSSESTQ